MANWAIMTPLTARDASRRPALATSVVFAVWADFGLGISRELIAPSETKMPAVNAAQRAPCVIASYRIDRTAGTFLPKRGRKDGAVPPQRPELWGAVKADLFWTGKIGGLSVGAGTPKIENLGYRTSANTADP